MSFVSAANHPHDHRGASPHSHALALTIAVLIGALIFGLASLSGPSHAAYSSEVLADSPWGYWKLDQSSGTTAADSSSAGTNTLTITPEGNSSPGWGADGPESSVTALDFRYDGYSNSVRDTAESSGVTGSGLFDDDFTVEMWLRRDVNHLKGSPWHTRGIQYLAGVRDCSSSSTHANDWGLWIDTNGELAIEAGPAQAMTTTGTFVPIDHWVHVALVVDGNSWQAYLNGQPAGSAVTGAGGSDGELRFGSRCHYGSGAEAGGLSGTLAHAAAFTSPLSAARIQAHVAEMAVDSPLDYAADFDTYGQAVLADDPFGYWRFEPPSANGASSGLPDSSFAQNKQGVGQGLTYNQESLSVDESDVSISHAWGSSPARAEYTKLTTPTPFTDDFSMEAWVQLPASVSGSRRWLMGRYHATSNSTSYNSWGDRAHHR